MTPDSFSPSGQPVTIIVLGIPSSSSPGRRIFASFGRLQLEEEGLRHGVTPETWPAVDAKRLEIAEAKKLLWEVEDLLEQIDWDGNGEKFFEPKLRTTTRDEIRRPWVAL